MLCTQNYTRLVQILCEQLFSVPSGYLEKAFHILLYKQQYHTDDTYALQP